MSRDFYALFSGEINFNSYQRLIGMIAPHCVEPGKTLHLAIQSGGGDIDYGIAFFNSLRALPVDLVTYNVGAIHSVANVMFLAGKHRVTSSSAVFGFHSSGFNIVDSNLRIDLAQVEEWQHKLTVNNQRLIDVLIRETQLTPGDAADLYQGEQFMPATWAVDNSVAHEIGEFSIPQGAHWLVCG